MNLYDAWLYRCIPYLLLISFCSRATARKNERQVCRSGECVGRGVPHSELYSRSSKQLLFGEWFCHIVWNDVTAVCFEKEVQVFKFLIDTLFGHVSTWLRRHGVLTLSGELFQYVSGYTKEAPQYTNIPVVRVHEIMPTVTIDQALHTWTFELIYRIRYSALDTTITYMYMYLTTIYMWL